MSSTPIALQLCPFTDRLERDLASRLKLVRWFELDAAAKAHLLASKAEECRVVVTGGHIGCPSELMRKLPALRLVAINGVGFDKVDLTCTKERRIAVTNTPDVVTDDVADLAVGLIIALMRRIPGADSYVREGRWPAGDVPLARKVSGSRFGIIGLGRIGEAIAVRLSPFGEVAYTARSEKRRAWRYFEDVASLAAWADVLVIACAANETTHKLVDAQVLRALGKNGVLVNVARGSVVDEGDLIQFLEGGNLAGAALDVFESEPDVAAALRLLDRTVLTPHIASATVETREAMARLLLANIDAFLAGRELASPVT